MSLYQTLFVVTVLLVFGGLFIKKIRQWCLSEPMLAMFGGILLGPYVLDILHLEALENADSMMQTATKLTIALALVATALRIPFSYPKDFRQTQSVILSLGMLLMWALSSVLVYIFFQPNISLALLVGAVITPTDPVVSSAIISGEFAEKYLSQKIRDTISFESGANDGLAYPIVLLAIYILGYSEAANVWDWILKVVLWENLAAFVIGLLSGYLLGKLMKFADKKNFMTSQTLLPFALAATFLVLSFLELIHTNSIIGVFGFGLMLNHAISKRERLEEEKVQESMERLFTVPIYFLFGLYLPINAWSELGVILLIAFGLSIMLFRRIPAFLLIKPILKHFSDIRDVTILGWYGPVGVAAIFYAMHTLHLTPYREVWHLASFVVFTSTIVHGLSSLPLARWYHLSRQKKD